MSVNDKRVFAMALVLMALMSIFVPVASAESGSQDWYLHNDLTLDKTGPGTGSKNVPEGESTKWSAGPAQCDLTMGAGTWKQSLDYVAPCAGTLYIWVGKEEGAIQVGAASVSISGTGSITEEEITGSSEEFDTGQHLQLRLKWYPSVGTPDLEVKCDSSAILTSPSTDPGYPVPELSSLILFSVGLLALAGYVVYKKKR